MKGSTYNMSVVVVCSKASAKALEEGLVQVIYDHFDVAGAEVVEIEKDCC